MVFLCSVEDLCRLVSYWRVCVFFFQAEDGIRDLVRSRGLGDVYKRQTTRSSSCAMPTSTGATSPR